MRFDASPTIDLRKSCWPTEVLGGTLAAAPSLGRLLHSPMSDVRDWLDSIKVGYGSKFGPSLEEFGVEDLVDLAQVALCNPNGPLLSSVTCLLLSLPHGHGSNDPDCHAQPCTA